MAAKKILVVYHANCADGFTAYWVAKRHFDFLAQEEDIEVTYKAGSYGDNHYPDFRVDEVYILDFSYKRRKMLEIIRKAGRVIILDHHKTAINELSDLLKNGKMEGILDNDRSGALITWDYFNPPSEDVETPVLVRYVSDRDLWKFELPHSKEVNSAIFSYEMTYENWQWLSTRTAIELFSDGEAILRKHEKDVKALAKDAVRGTILGHEVPIVNANYTYGSDIASLLAEGEKFAAYYWMRGEEIKFGLRSSKDGGLDVSEIAEHFGGGGHKHAAGFNLPNGAEFDRLNNK